MAELIVIGSGNRDTLFTERFSRFVVLSDNSTLLIDSGSGTLRRMLDVGLTYRDIDLLLYTHIHPDHVSDLVPILLRVSMQIFRAKKICCALGAPGFKSYFEKLSGVYGPWIAAQSYQLTVKEISQEVLRLQGLEDLIETHGSYL